MILLLPSMSRSLALSLCRIFSIIMIKSLSYFWTWNKSPTQNSKWKAYEQQM